MHVHFLIHEIRRLADEKFFPCFWEYRDDLGLPDLFSEALLHARRSAMWDVKILKSTENRHAEAMNLE